MRDWLAFVTSGAMTSMGVVAATSGCDLKGPFYGSFVLVMLYSLWYANGKLWGDAPC